MPKVGRRSDPLVKDLHYSSNGPVQRNAPFGTTYTPTFRVKIIGGKPVTVVEHRKEPTEDHGSLSNDSSSPHGGSTSRKSPMLAPLTEKPNHIDPTVFHRKSNIGFHSAQKDDFNSHIHGVPSKYSIVPPIGYGRNVDGVKMERPVSNLQGPGILSQHQTTVLPEYQEDELYRHLPQYKYLPDEPIVLRKEEELSLLQSVHRNLRGMEFMRLKEIYTELTGYDRHLTGYVTYQDLSFTFLRNQITIPPQTLRLIAALYVSVEYPGMVNYEKVLTFIQSAMKDQTDAHHQHQTKGPESPRRMQPVSEPPLSPRSMHTSVSPIPQDQRSTYYNPILQQGERYNKGSRRINNDRETSKLIRMLEQAMQGSDEEIDFEKIYATFRQADRERRGCLSAQQIKDLTYYNRLPLQESLTEQIIAMCDNHNGQYDWQHFLEFIERVLPAHTGLKIPPSKRPLEYAIQYPEPGLNWPKHETPRSSPIPSDIRSSPRNMQTPYQWQHHESLTRPALPDIPTQNPKQRDIDPNSYLEPQRHPRDYDMDKIQQDVNKQTRVDQIEHQLQELQSAYEQSKRKLMLERQVHETEPWFDRFMKLANAMYNNDADHSGYLQFKDTMWLLKEYNDTYNLNFSEPDLDKYARAFCTDGERVHIDSLLRQLSHNADRK